MKRQLTTDILVCLLLLAASMVCFYDVLPLGFFSDDYYVMHRLTIAKVFWAPGFFRPLSDISLLFSYYLSGYDAFDYRLFNVLLHCLNGFLLYKTLQLIFPFNDHRRQLAALVAAVLFIVYPFHTESMIWIVGRASLIANCFGLLGLYVFFRQWNEKLKIGVSCLLYFIGLTSYESIIIIPGIIFFAAWYAGTFRKAVMTSIPFAITLVAHIVVRMKVSGVFTGNYGVDMFGEGQTNYLAKFIKSFGRLFIPGLHSNVVLLILFILVLLAMIASFYFLFTRYRKFYNFYLLCWIYLLVSHMVPTMFGVDTHTTDGERLLYFPSLFLCAIIAYFICVVATSRRQVWITTIVLSIGFLVLLKRTNSNWIKADAAITHILETVKATCCEHAYFINMPDGIEGSFTFRNGFQEALQMHQIDAQVQVVNYLLNQQAIKLPDTIRPVSTPDGYFQIPPAVKLTADVFVADSLGGGRKFTKRMKRDSAAAIFYWNRNKVVTLPQ